MNLDQKLDVLAIGTHPDDVELACGATLAQMVSAGRRVGVLHLTRGEAGTRGTPEGREIEARKAAEALGVSAVEFLDCGDGGLRHGRAEEDSLIEVLRRWRPEILLGPTPADRHPDHARAHALVADAAFYSGLARRGEGDAWRPAAVFSYMQHDPFEPSFVVDAGAGWERKLAALAEYRSQLHQEDGDDRGPATKVASREFRAAVEGRARHYGMMIGVEFGEPFLSRLPLSVSDPLDLAPGGLR